MRRRAAVQDILKVSTCMKATENKWSQTFLTETEMRGGLLVLTVDVNLDTIFPIQYVTS